MRTCKRCSQEKGDHLFSRAKRYRDDPLDPVGYVCLACVYEEERERLRERIGNQRKLHAYKKKVVHQIKKEIRDKVTAAAILAEAKKNGAVVDVETLKQARAEARTRTQKRTADTMLRRMIKERKKALETLPEEELPPHLARAIEDMDFLLNEKSQKQKEFEANAKRRAKAVNQRRREAKLRELSDEEVMKQLKETDNRIKEKKLSMNPKSDATTRDASAKDSVKKELAARILARRKLIHFITRMKPNYLAGWVHHDICRRLEKFVEDVAEGKDPRLMLFMPPRHGKSLIASDMFPSWVLGQHPDWEFIAASYAVSLPIEFSRNIRDRMKDEAYQQLFPKVNLRQDSQSSERWLTKQGGGYIAAGVGTGISGKGAHILMIDDPIKDAQEADSETVRETAWSWWSSTASTRLAPNSGVLIIQTRWHDDDLSGRLISQMKELKKEGAPKDEIDNWEIIEYPALATETEWLTKAGEIIRSPTAANVDDYKLRGKGEALHPARYDYKRLMRKKRTMEPRHWSALYQQNPVPDEGVYFTKDMFRYTGSLPPLHQMNIFAAFDLAIGEKQQNDYTVGVVGGLDYNDQLIIFDLVRFKGDSFKIVEAILNVYEKYHPSMIGIEKGQLELAIKPILKKRMRERRLYPTLAEGEYALVPITDKMTRARPLQGRMQQGMLYFLDTQPWLETLRYEMLRFPGGVNDDIVDACAWLARLALSQKAPKKPTNKEASKSWKKQLDRYVNAGRQHPMGA
jgi:predicted phage terminase large subunit-like protein